MNCKELDVDRSVVRHDSSVEIQPFCCSEVAWQRPDWRKKEQYPVDSISLHQWYWQFLRRREDYQQAYWNHAQETYETYERWKANGVFPCNESTRVIKPTSKRFESMIPSSHKEFFTTSCPNPSCDYPEFFHYSGDKSIRAQCGQLGNEEALKPIPKIDNLDEANELLQRAGYIEPNHARITFNLALPIQQQIDVAKDMLIRSQKVMLYEQSGSEDGLEPKPIQVKRHLDKWPLYLRALDARWKGETLEEIGAVLSAPGDSEQDIEDHLFKVGSKKLKEKGSEIFGAAERVGFNFPF